LKCARRSSLTVSNSREALDGPDLVFKREGGGFSRLDRIFEGLLSQVLETFNDAIWQKPAA